MTDAAQPNIPQRIIVRIVADTLTDADAHAALVSLETWMAQEPIDAETPERRPLGGGSKAFELWELVYVATGALLPDILSPLKAGIRSWQVHRAEANGRAETIRLIDGADPAAPPEVLDPRDLGLDPDDDGTGQSA